MICGGMSFRLTDDSFLSKLVKKVAKFTAFMVKFPIVVTQYGEIFPESD